MMNNPILKTSPNANPNNCGIKSLKTKAFGPNKPKMAVRPNKCPNNCGIKSLKTNAFGPNAGPNKNLVVSVPLRLPPLGEAEGRTRSNKSMESPVKPSH